MATYIILYKFCVKGPLSIEEDAYLETCKKNWWMNLLYINNINNISVVFSLNKTHSYNPIYLLLQCMGWTWYLAADMQFYVLAPIFIYSLYR